MEVRTTTGGIAELSGAQVQAKTLQFSLYGKIFTVPHGSNM